MVTRLRVEAIVNTPHHGINPGRLSLNGALEAVLLILGDLRPKFHTCLSI